MDSLNSEAQLPEAIKESFDLVKDSSQMSDAILKRLMEEVKNDTTQMFAYDRAHNRHNRGR